MTYEMFEPDAIDFYDYDAMEKLQEKRAKKYMDLAKRWYDAKEKKDDKSAKKALKVMSKHRDQNEILKEKSKQSGYYWY